MIIGCMQPSGFREALREYIQEQARPLDKFSHQARLYALARDIATQEGQAYDDDVLYAAAWLHDLGVFIGHRPEETEALAKWDHVAYVLRCAPSVLAGLGFPREKMPTVLDVIRTHLPDTEPSSVEGILLRDADILEQLGAVGILRTVSKIGRDTRFVRFSDALAVLRRNLQKLPGMLRLSAARRLAEPRVFSLESFLNAAEVEAAGIEW